MKPTLDPKRDLAGATPESLARALLRPVAKLDAAKPPQKAPPSTPPKGKGDSNAKPVK